VIALHHSGVAKKDSQGRTLTKDGKVWNGLPLEAVHIDQSTLVSRPGYQPNFLGSGKLAVPLPKILALKSSIAMLKSKPKQSELKYFNYSVVMNKDRKLAFYSAVNIDADQGRWHVDKDGLCIDLERAGRHCYQVWVSGLFNALY
jgi:hypothetical protein